MSLKPNVSKHLAWDYNLKFNGHLRIYILPAVKLERIEMTAEEAIDQIMNIGLIAKNVITDYIYIVGGVPVKDPENTVIYPFLISYETNMWIVRCHLPKPNPNEEVLIGFGRFDEAVEKIISLYENCRVDWEYERDNHDPNAFRTQE